MTAVSVGIGEEWRIAFDIVGREKRREIDGGKRALPGRATRPRDRGWEVVRYLVAPSR